MMPFFSIIIPLYNKQDYILKTLDSVFAQTFENYEIIVVDDGTTDQSVSLVELLKHPKMQLIRQTNKGVSVARNVGIAAAIGKFIALLDADDLWLPNHLESLYRLIHKFPNAGLYCSRYAIKYHENFTKDILFSQVVPRGMSIIKDYFAASLINPIAWISAVAFRKIDFLEVGVFDANLRTAEDIDLFIRFVEKHPVAFNNSVTMIYEKNTSLDSLSKVEYNDERHYFVNKYRLEEGTNPSLKIYLDQNRFALALRSKIVGDLTVYKKQLHDIDASQLNTKQRLLLTLPSFALAFLAKTHQWLIKKHVYIKPLR